jgi:2-hydroxy-6-oxonona-2,4-dienedioate hydrolase
MNDFSPETFRNALVEVDVLQAAAERIETPCGSGRMVWYRWGEGRTVLLLHGGAGSWRHWVRNVPILAERYRVLAPDLPGLGESDMPEPWDPEVSADIIAAGLERLIPPGETFDVVGFSAGAMVAGLLAARVKERCRMLVIVGAGGLGTGRNPISLEKVRSKQGEERWCAHVANLERLMIADPARIDAQALAIQDWNTVHTRVNSVGFAESPLLRNALTETNAVLKAIWGSEDAPARNSLDERCNVLRQLRPDAEIRIIPKAGHWVAYETADAFNEVLIAMLDSRT